MANRNTNMREMAPLVELTVCAGSRRRVPDSRYLRCSKCLQFWDIDCENVPESRFYNTMSKENKSMWACPECACKQPKGGDNTETPFKSSAESFIPCNVTVRRETARNRLDNLDVSEMSLDASHVQDDDTSLLVEASQTATHTVSSSASLNNAVQSIISELRLFRDEMREELKATRVQIEALKDGMLQLSGRIARCESHVCGLNERVKTIEHRQTRDSEDSTARLNGFMQRLDNIERSQEEAAPVAPDSGTVVELERTVSEFRHELNDRDQEALLADLEIGQLPEERGENVLHSVIVLANQLGVKLEERDVVFAERVGAPPGEGARARRVVVRLTRRHICDELLRAARVRRTAMAKSGAKVFINERLTRSNRQQFHRVREECRRLQWRFTWTRRGRIFARKNDGAQAYQLRSLDDITRVFGAPLI